ncbi:hypothetical protein H6P81_000475 [Aristolochia fimbriata]|uniref:Uncharacterized protein n=1 Tax=Aristolochia fimbriata TaxID=158543 RepID=A0AAV7F7J6_ARIFI|nr:hypothetical protein H6P81_000475 [Aristolochia fimbriata]
MIKALKKLKTWSRKKKRRRSSIVHPPLHSHCCCSCSSTPQPSAPPLPSWLDYEPQQETVSVSVPSHLFRSSTESGFSYASAQPHIPVPPPEIATETTPLYATSAVPTSYQQYFVPEPVCGVPAVPVDLGKRAEGGIFGCVASFGNNLIRCFFPCFRFRSHN